MKFQLKELDNKESQIAWVFLHSINTEEADKIYKTFSGNADDDSEFDVKMTINGIDIDAEKAFKQLYEAIEYNAKCKAKEMFQNAFNDKIYSMIDTLNDMSERVNVISDDISWDKIYTETFTK